MNNSKTYKVLAAIYHLRRRKTDESILNHITEKIDYYNLMKKLFLAGEKIDDDFDLGERSCDAQNPEECESCQ